MQEFKSSTFAFFNLAKQVLERAHSIAVDVKLAVAAIFNQPQVFKVAPCFRYKVECVAPDGSIRWTDYFENIVFDAGINDLLDKYFAGSSYTAAWFMGLVDNASFSPGFQAADVMSSHAGWLESAAYSNSTRPAITWSSAASKSKAASAACVFNINATATINGAFIASNSTKSGTTGVLYSAGSFGSTRSVINGDTLNVTPTVSGA